MSRFTSFSKIGRRSAVIAGAALSAITALAPIAKGSMVISMEFTDGTTTKTLTAANVGVNITVRVYATITGANAITQAQAADGSPSTTGNHDGIGYAYYNVQSSVVGTAVAGNLTVSATNGALGLNKAGSAQNGLLNDFNGDGVIDVGNNAGITANMIKPSSAGIGADSTGTTAFPGVSNTFDNYALNNGDGTFTFRTTPNVIVTGNSVKLLLSTLTYKLTSFAAGQTTNYGVLIPSAASIAPVVGANWFQDTTDETSTNGIQNGAYTAGSGVQFTTGVVSGAAKIINLTAASGNVSAVALAGTFNPNGTGTSLNKVNVVGSAAAGYNVGQLNSITGTPKTGQTELSFETSTASGAITDPGTEIIGLNFAGATAADITRLINDFNNVNSATITGLPGATAGSPEAFASNDPAVTAAKNAIEAANPHPADAYDIFLKVPTSAATGLGDSFLGLDLTADSTLSAGISVADVAAVPEPVMMGGLLLGAVGLLGRRRARKA